MATRSPRAIGAAACALVLACLASAAHAFPAMTFDAFADGTPITNQYAAQGVLYSSVSGLPCTIYLDPVEATSGANILVGASTLRDINLTMVDPATGLPSPSWQACHVGLNVISAGWSVVQVTSHDAGGAALQTFTVTHPSGPRNGLGNVDHLDFSAGSIASVSMVFTLVDFGDGIGLDDVIVDFGCATPTRSSTWGALKSLYR